MYVANIQKNFHLKLRNLEGKNHKNFANIKIGVIVYVFLKSSNYCKIKARFLTTFSQKTVARSLANTFSLVEE